MAHVALEPQLISPVMTSLCHHGLAHNIANSVDYQYCAEHYVFSANLSKNDNTSKSLNSTAVLFSVDCIDFII